MVRGIAAQWPGVGEPLPAPVPSPATAAFASKGCPDVRLGYGTLYLKAVD